MSCDHDREEIDTLRAELAKRNRKIDGLRDAFDYEEKRANAAEAQLAEARAFTTTNVSISSGMLRLWGTGGVLVGEFCTFGELLDAARAERATSETQR